MSPEYGLGREKYILFHVEQFSVTLNLKQVSELA